MSTMTTELSRAERMDLCDSRRSIELLGYCVEYARNGQAHALAVMMNGYAQATLAQSDERARYLGSGPHSDTYVTENTRLTAECLRLHSELKAEIGRHAGVAGRWKDAR